MKIFRTSLHDPKRIIEPVPVACNKPRTMRGKIQRQRIQVIRNDIMLNLFYKSLLFKSEELSSMFFCQNNPGNVNKERRHVRFHKTQCRTFHYTKSLLLFCSNILPKLVGACVYPSFLKDFETAM